MRDKAITVLLAVLLIAAIGYLGANKQRQLDAEDAYVRAECLKRGGIPIKGSWSARIARCDGIVR